MSDKDAIQSDVSEELNDAAEVQAEARAAESEDTPSDRKAHADERQRKLEDIARQVEERDGLQREPLGGEAEPDAPEVAEEKESEPDPLETLGYYRNDSGDLVTKIKVNGVEREVSAEQVKAHLQKDLAGDWKLQQAAEKERQLQEMARSLQQERDKQIQQSMSQATQPPTLGAEEAKKQALQVLEKIWDGDTDAAAEELAKIIQRPGATVDQGKILEEARKAAQSELERRESQRQQEAWQRSVDDGNRELREQHPEIYADERLFDLVNRETERMVTARQAGVAEFAEMSPRDMIVRAAESVQGWLNQSRKPSTSTTSRSERKANLKPVPRGMNATQNTKPAPEVDMSPAAVIERMAAARRVN